MGLECDLHSEVSAFTYVDNFVVILILLFVQLRWKCLELPSVLIMVLLTHH